MTEKRFYDKGPSGDIRRMQSIKRALKPPEWAGFSTEEELRLWDQMSTARDVDNWRACDIEVIVQIVRLKTICNGLMDQLLREGFMIENSKEEMVEHPLVKTYAKFNQQVITASRMLGLYTNAGAQNARENKRGMKEEQMRRRLEETAPVHDLFA
jgi:P27 family predicted phage terminase small subunit